MKRASSLRLTLWPMPPMGVSTVAICSSSARCGRRRWLLLRLRSGLLIPCPHLATGALDRLDDVHVAGAAAHVPGDRPADLLFRRIGVSLQQGRADEHHRRRAEAALKPVLLLERLLDGMKGAVARQALDGGDLPPVGLDREHRARLDRRA